ncbi:fumarylacetoacetate hydrolase family protein [Amycolatopsis pithecellobii]|uniref:Fumarylacetoacetate hydrolase n=1 Tax=Amycolatopsis pithecellobii TaxID=664692 RepID=A0A6N7Z7Y4_9PSEU|nr:fumarylacetoacetate hydrolase family protein [Amycolatopsis pithecellobii]MTD57551.1 fumarylacetoacetate hydrolase [Amycolatopsis pithecellobii]
MALRLAKTPGGWCVLGDSGAVIMLGRLPSGTTLGSLLALPAAEFADRLASVPLTQTLAPQLLAPVDDDTEVWAAGVTYEVSREARMHESIDADVYARVYQAPRPELFFKSIGWRVAGPGGRIGVRDDSTWDVPEPELGIVCNAEGAIVGYTIVNDVSSRSIEGENPLYLPQAKIFRGACAVGPWIVPASEIANPYVLGIFVRINRGGAPLWSGETSTARLHRKLADLAAYLYRGDVYPRGVILATGTSAVPGDEISLRRGDEVIIDVDRVGRLDNPVG